MKTFKYKDVAPLSKTGAGEAKLIMEVIASNIEDADAVFEATHGQLKKQKTIVVSVERDGVLENTSHFLSESARQLTLFMLKPPRHERIPTSL